MRSPEQIIETALDDAFRRCGFSAARHREAVMDALRAEGFVVKHTGLETVSCVACGTAFKRGGNSGRRADAKFCDDPCRKHHKYLERKQRLETRAVPL